MHHRRFFGFTVAALILFLAGCSRFNEAPLVTKNSLVEKSQTLIILGVHWKETANNPEIMKMEETDSESLIQDEVWVGSKRIDMGSTELREPLYYFSNLKILLDGMNKKDEKPTALTRFGLDLNGYETIGIHAVESGLYSITALRYTAYVLRLPMHHRDTAVRKDPQNAQVNFSLGTFDLQPGKIYYLGDVELTVHTKRVMYGLMPREALIDSLGITKIEWKDQFQKTLETLAKTRPWFPKELVINAAKEMTLEFPEKVLYGATDEGQLVPKEQIEEAPQKEKGKQYFF